MQTEKPGLPALGVVSAAISGWNAAQPRFAALLKTGAPESQALARWSLELLRAGQVPAAISALRAALALTPNDPVMWANYGIALGQANDAAHAIACLEHSIALFHRQPDTWLMLGIARKNAGQLAEAEAACRVALEQEPGSGVAWQVIAVIKEQQKDFAAAIDCLEAALKTGGAGAAVLANLAKLQHQLGHIAESAGSYAQAANLDPASAHYRQMARKTDFMRRVLQGATIDDAIAGCQNSFPSGQSCSEPELLELLHSSFSLLSGFGHTEAAAHIGRRYLELRPADPSLTYLLSAVAAEQTFDQSPPEYVIEHFDAFAAGFEAKLVGALGYDLPQKISAALRDLTPPGRLYDTLDAGCGTGLCGPLLRPLSRSLAGVDLSPRMIEQAAAKSVYDTLLCGELCAFLQTAPARFDLIMAADLIIYFGDLAPVFAAAAAALRPDGILAFSTELWRGRGFRLLPTGRFAHAPDYVRQTAAPNFTEAFHTETTIRLEAAARLPGHIFIFRRRHA